MKIEGINAVDTGASTLPINTNSDEITYKYDNLQSSKEDSSSNDVVEGSVL